jgi:hypothetical protein
LIHPSSAPLGWFSDAPIAAVRRIRRIRAEVPHRATAPTRPSMLAIRGTHGELSGVDLAYERLRRRSRTRRVHVLGVVPIPITGRRHLEEAAAREPDILHLWAHCGPQTVAFSPTWNVTVDDAADVLTADRAPRLVVLVGCRSGVLARRLVERGVVAVVAMRVEVMNHTIAPLVEDLTSEVLSGAAVDLAFATALRRYLLTGQPGAAAVPVLHLAHDVGVHLFS